VGFGEAQLPAHDVGAFDQRHAFVVSDSTAQTLASKPTIGGDHQLLLRDVFERLSDQRGDMLGRLDGGDAVVDDADADLFVGLVFGEERQVTALARGAFEGDDVAIELQ